VYDFINNIIKKKQTNKQKRKQKKQKRKLDQAAHFDQTNKNKGSKCQTQKSKMREEGNQK